MAQLHVFRSPRCRRAAALAAVLSAALAAGCAVPATDASLETATPSVPPPATTEPPVATPAAPMVETVTPAPPATVESELFTLGEEAEAALAQARLEAQNTAVVVAFYDLIFNEHRVSDAFDRYGGEGYIQHSPGSPDGRAAVVAALTPYFEANPLATSEIKRVIAQGDLVVLHVHAKANPVDRGRAVVEIFRVEDGRVVEHWDVIQPVPAGAANENSMF